MTKTNTLARTLAAVYRDLEVARRAYVAAEAAYVASLREDTARRRAALAAKAVRP